VQIEINDSSSYNSFIKNSFKIVKDSSFAEPMGRLLIDNLCYLLNISSNIDNTHEGLHQRVFVAESSGVHEPERPDLKIPSEWSTTNTAASSAVSYVKISQQ